MKTWQKLYKSVLSKPNRVFLGIFLIAVLTYSAGIFKVGSILWGDARYYYAYTHSIIVDGDLNFDNEAYLPDLGFPNDPETSEITGRITNKFSIGAPILWIPAFVVGYALTGDGYSWFTQYLVGLSGVGFSVLGLYYIFKSLAKLFSTKTALLSVLILLLTTGILYYTFLDPLNSHSASLMLSSWLLWMVVSVGRGEITSKLLLKMGSVSGLLFLVRNQDVLVLLPVILAVIFMLKDKILALKISTAGLVGLLVGFLVQQKVVFYLFGQYGSPYLIRGESFSWFKPDFLRVLFSQGNGLIYFSPIVLLCLWGLWQMLMKRNALAILASSIFLLQLYLIATWGPEIVGGPYGSRMFLSSLPWLGVGLGFFVGKIEKRFVVAGIVLTSLLINNLIQTGRMLVVF